MTLLAVGCIACSLASAVTAAPPDARVFLDQVERAHERIPPIECRYDIASACTGPDGEQVKSLLAMSPRVRAWTDPRTGGSYLIWMSVRSLYDGSARWRIETEDTTSIGPRDLAVAVALLGPELQAQSQALKSLTANVTTATSFLDLDDRTLRERRILSMRELVAREGYPTLVTWCTRMLRLADDLAVLDDEHGAGVASASLGIELWADPATGEVSGVRLANMNVGPNAWWFEGRFDEPLFPARHPRLVRLGTPIPGSENEADGARYLFTSVRSVEIDPALFKPTSLATKFFDARTSSYVDAEGQPLGTDERSSPRPPPATSAPRAREIADSVTGTPRSLVAAGIACFLVAGMIWWRRSTS